MTETLIQNLEVLSESTDSLHGLVLQLSKSGCEVLASFNEHSPDIAPLENDLYKLFLEDRLNQENIFDTESFLYLSAEKGIKSIFLEKIFEVESEYSVFLILLSNLKDSYTKEKITAVRKYIMELNKQIKEHLTEDIESAGKITSFSGEWFTKNRELIFSTLLSSFSDLFIVLDDNGYIIAVNKNGARSLDFSELELRGKYLLDYVKSEERQGVIDVFNKALINESNIEHDITLIGKYENEIPFHMNFSVIINDDKIVGMLGTGRTVVELNSLKNKNTELKNRLNETVRLLNIENTRSELYKDILADLNRLKNDFVSNLSHEFRTPLASIIGFAETLISDKGIPEEMKREFEEIILLEGKKLAKLINDILELSRYEQGKIELNTTEFDVSDMLKSIVVELTPVVENKGLILSCNFPAVPVKLIADKEKLNLAFHGILNNSIKYTPSKGRITCLVKVFREEVEFIFTDTGTGISEKEFPYIFHKFYHSSRGSSEYMEKDADLVFIKQIIDLHKGIIKVQSERDKGTSVLIKLPIKLN